MASAFSGLQWKRSCRYATTWFTMYPGFNQSQGRNTALCSSMPISFQAQAQFNSFFFVSYSNTSLLMTSPYAFSELLSYFPRSRSWLEHIFLYLLLLHHSRYNITSMGKEPCCQGNQEECISSASVGSSILVSQILAVFFTHLNFVDTRK